MKIIGTISINISDIMVYLAMFSSTIDKILCFLYPPSNFKVHRHKCLMGPIFGQKYGNNVSCADAIIVFSSSIV